MTTPHIVLFADANCIAGQSEGGYGGHLAAPERERRAAILLNDADVAGRREPPNCRHVEPHDLLLRQLAKPRPLQFGNMYEHVLPWLVGLDEPIPLRAVVPLNDA